MTITQKTIGVLIGLVALCVMAPFALATSQYASAVHSNLQGTLKNGNPITDPNRADPEFVVGAPDGKFYSLGFNGGNEANGGWIVLEYPTLMAGGALTISPQEVTNGTYPLERAEVFVSSDASTWHSIGFATNGSGVGPNPHGTILPVSEEYCVKYVKLVDATDPNLHSATADGFDVDAVEADFATECPGHIIVEKQTNPNGSGEPFSFSPSWGDGFSLHDNEQHDSGALAAGEYSVNETVPSGWAQTDVTCSDGSNPNAISLQAGETVTCVFTNTQKGMITVEKQTNPADSDQSFDFDPSWSENNFSLKDNGYLSTELLPGEYQVVELPTQGWTQTSAVCVSDMNENEDPGSIVLSAGEHITCTFTNTMDETPPPPPTTDPCEVDHSCACGPVTVVTHNNATVSNTVITKSSTGKNTATGGTAGKGGNGGNGGMFGGQGGNGGTGGAGGTGGVVSTGGAVSVSTIHNIVNNVLVRIRR